MDVIHRHVAGFDVHEETIAVCVRHITEAGKVQKVVRTYRTVTRDLTTLVRWLINERVTHVAMESTGVYWKPVFNVLEEEGDFHVLLCNAQHVKQVPGRKTDVSDCEWLAQLLQHGLLKGSFIPPRSVRELRDLTRLRARFVEQKTATTNRLHKVLQDANIKLTSVATDVKGASGWSMIEALIGGQNDPARLAELARGKLRGKIPELERALEGRVTDHHRFLLTVFLDEIARLDERISSLDARVQRHMAEADAAVPPTPAEAGPLFENVAPAADGEEAGPTPLPFCRAVELLVTIPGVGLRTAENVIAEIGTDMSQFPSAKHLASWAGICPGNNESAGKRQSGKTRKGSRWLRRALMQAAWAATRTKDVYFSSAYKRWAARRGKKKAVIAVAHALLVAAYHMLRASKSYADLGPDHFDKIDPQRQIRYHVRRLAALGQAVTLATAG